MKKSLMLMGGGEPPIAGAIKDAADLDGANDYFSRGSDFVGNTDSKTFTFSAWVYVDVNQSVNSFIYEAYNGAATRFSITFDNASKYINITGVNVSGTTILSAQTAAGSIQYNTFYHLLISVDLASASNRSVYINDVPNFVTWGVYTNDSIEFTVATHGVGSRGSTPVLQCKGRLAHVFLDYTYRDLSIEANRRLFVEYNADGYLVPTANQASLNPILYMPFDDATQFFVNQGTGGNFVQNGTMAQSNVGASDYSAAASGFDGVADSLTTASIAGISDSKTVSCSFNIVTDDETGNRYVSTINGSINGLTVDTFSGNLRVIGRNTAGTIIYRVDAADITLINGRNICVSISFDLSNISNRHFQVNGVEISPTYTTYTDDTLDLTGSNNYIGASNTGSDRWDGNLSEYWFDTTYIDLSANNPFYDVETGKPKPLGQNGELPTGLPPLVYLPMRADSAGTNKGTGGDFTENSGPYVGARGPSEYWARGCVVDGTNYLSGSIFCQSLVKWLSVDSGVTWTPTYANAVTVTDIGNGTDNGVVAYYFGTSENINWALEENKLRFTDAFGYPIPPVLDANSVLFLDFADTTNFGLNQAGADYTVTGTPTAGADVTA